MSRTILGSVLLFATTPTVALTLNLQVQNETCSYMNGSVYASVSGGVPPYTYMWGGGETTESLSNLSAGTYSVTVTDFLGEQVSDQATVLSEDYGSSTSGITHAYCPGQNYHEFFFPPQPPGVFTDFGPWSASQGIIGEVPPPASPGNYYLDIGPINPGSSHMVTYWDANGCSGTLSFTAGYPVTSWPTFNVVDVQGSCSAVATGQITFTSSPIIGTDTYYALRAEGSGNDLQYLGGFQMVSTGLYAFTSLPPGNYWLKHRLGLTYSLVQGGSCSSDSVLVTVPNYGPTCGSISGSTYMDYNSDCMDTEADAMNVVVEIQPGPIYASAGGAYSVVVPNGSYTLTTSGAAIAQSCPASATVNGNNVVANIGHEATVPLDAAIGVSSGPARPGFELHYYLHVENLSPASSGATTTTFTFDPAVSFIGALPAPSNVSGNTITWNQSALSLFQDRDYFIRLQVPPDVGLIGTELLADATISTVNTDSNLGNNTASAAITVTGSYDPNDKTAYTSTRWSNELYYIDEDAWIDYVIRFQNTGTDTAFNIVVTDTLPSTLDPATISLASASHNHTWMLQGQGILKFIFPNILLPDSNVNEPASHGLISFRIRPRLPLAPGLQIENIANIYFDFNPPVITEPSLLVAEFSTGVVQPDETSNNLKIYPNPAQHQVVVQFDGDRIVELELFSPDGRRMLHQAVNDRTITVDFDALAAGIYTVRVRASRGSIHHTNLIKQ